MNKIKHVQIKRCSILSKIIIGVSILIAIGLLPVGYLIGAHMEYQTKSEHYNMITGCPLLDHNCTDDTKITCVDPFYENCYEGGYTAVLMLLYVECIIIFAEIIIICPACRTIRNYFGNL